MDDESPNKSSKTTAAAIAMLVALPLLYVLSVGPVAAFMERDSWYWRHPRLAKVVASFYSPLEPLFTHKTLGPLLQRYANWWIDQGKKPDPFLPESETGVDPFAPAPVDPFGPAPASPPAAQDPK